ncbi:MAG TPA: GNAT family N-acetyltransferase [Chloroflexota bacterium]|nr:GNAT family N-acetyltransferase [Chloroflexota bacterium]
MADLEVHEISRSAAQDFFEVEWRQFNYELFGEPFLWLLTGEYHLGATFGEGELLGAARYTIAEGVGYLRELIVKGGHRSQGFGRQLLTAYENDCRRRGCHKLCLDVASANVRARDFYRGNGWEQEGLMRRHWREVDFEVWIKWL